MFQIVFGLIAKFNVCQRRSRATRRRENLRARGQRLLVLVGATRGRRQQARGPRGSIEIAKCAHFRTNCEALVRNYRRWAIVLRLCLSALLTFQVLNISIYNACTVEE